MKAFVLIALKEGIERELLRDVKEYHEVNNAYILFGEWDIILEMEVADAEQLGTFVMENIRSREDVRLTSSLIVAGK
ncbi:MAG: Lrp/AsnC ligand binding domain-containing protein, partial [Nanoarchaeota archaeon]